MAVLKQEDRATTTTLDTRRRHRHLALRPTRYWMTQIVVDLSGVTQLVSSPTLRGQHAPGRSRVIRVNDLVSGRILCLSSCQ